MRKKRKLNARERNAAAKAAAMPEVKRMVKKHGLTAVSGCLIHIKGQNALAKRIANLKKEATELSKRMR
jgi:hypothetical protein